MRHTPLVFLLVLAACASSSGDRSSAEPLTASTAEQRYDTVRRRLDSARSAFRDSPGAPAARGRLDAALRDESAAYDALDGALERAASDAHGVLDAEIERDRDLLDLEARLDAELERAYSRRPADYDRRRAEIERGYEAERLSIERAHDAAVKKLESN